jgi:hypothetical protein
MCGRTDWIERHHVFGGSNRKKSEKYDLVADLCHFCHNEPPDGVHFNRANNLRLKQKYQRIFEHTHTREEFVSEFGKNYMDD